MSDISVYQSRQIPNLNFFLKTYLATFISSSLNFKLS